jgi:hypothetical protein
MGHVPFRVGEKANAVLRARVNLSKRDLAGAYAAALVLAGAETIACLPAGWLAAAAPAGATATRAAMVEPRARICVRRFMGLLFV